MVQCLKPSNFIGIIYIGKVMPMKNDVNRDEALTKIIFDMLQNISFGTITIVVQNGKVIQLEKNEKIRLK